MMARAMVAWRTARCFGNVLSAEARVAYSTSEDDQSRRQPQRRPRSQQLQRQQRIAEQRSQHPESTPPEKRHVSTQEQRPQAPDRHGDPHGGQHRRLPSLTDFPEIAFPKLSHTLKNWFLAHTLIAPYFDPEFDTNDFISGAKAAVQLVSECLSSGDLEPLQHLIEPNCLQMIKNNISTFSLSQRSALAVKEKDIFLSFVYQIGILLEDHPDMDKDSEAYKQTRHVEITFVGHAYPDVDDLGDTITSISDGVSKIRAGGGPIVVNYRFIREFTKGVEDQWTINALNYFYLEEKE